MTLARLEKLKTCLDRRQPDLTVITDNVHKPHNVSAIIRTCDAVGVFSLHAVMAADERFRARSGIAMGSDKWLDIHLHDDAAGIMKSLTGQGYRIAAVHKSDRSVDFRQVDYTRPIAVLFGAEKFGVSDHAASLATDHVCIPMMGMVESYNVSVAAAIVLLEAQRQRDAAGQYARRSLDEQTYQRTLFRWYRRAEADFCDRHCIDYPAMDDSGNLVDPIEFSRQRAALERSESESN